MEVVFDDEDDKGATPTALSKKQRNEKRKETNKKWKLVDRKVGSGVDPNPRHTEYYKVQLPYLQPPEEWDKFQQALVNPLCVTFRIGSCCPLAVQQSIVAKMSRDFRTLVGRFLELNGSIVKDNVVKLIEWMRQTSSISTDMYVWQVVCDSATLAREVALSSLSNYMRREVALGHIVRQELASMLPAVLLDVQSHHTVLDVCAAPGSKTEQLLYLMQRHCQHQAGNSLQSSMTGVVVANDADPVRIETLRKRYNRCGSPNLLITCARAENLNKTVLRALRKRNKQLDDQQVGLFDRIVADVPCSGDGTIRKFPHVWRLFRPRMALELHSIQLQIAIASVQMLKPGGRIVYSTCSTNPIEDEAVVCGLLRYFQGQLHLVDTRSGTNNILPELKSRPGLTNWIVNKDIFTVGEPDAAAKKDSLNRLVPITPSMHPPTKEENDDAVNGFHLEYCHRILPQDQDMGGFFVAVLERTRAPTEAVADETRMSLITEEESMATMKRLGYNPISASSAVKHPKVNNNKPKKTQASSSREGEEVVPAVADEHTIAYEPLDEQVIERLCLTAPESTVLMQSSTRKYIRSTQKQQSTDNDAEADATNSSLQKPQIKKGSNSSGSNGIFGSKKDGWIKKEGPMDDDDEDEFDLGDEDNDGEGTEGMKFVSLLSSGALDTLQLLSKYHSKQSSTTQTQGGLVRQAGVEIGSYNEYSGELKLYGDAARRAIGCYDRSSEHTQNIVKVDPQCFLTLCEKAIEVTGPEYIVRGLDDEAESMLVRGFKLQAAESGNTITKKRIKKLGNIFVVTEAPVAPTLIKSQKSKAGTTTGVPVGSLATIAGGSDSVLGKRRMSKAERKKLKNNKTSSGDSSSLDNVNEDSLGADDDNTEVAGSSGHTDGDTCVNAAEGMILLLRYNIEYDCFYFVTEADMCASYVSTFRY
jgi:16S rRNA C967 or C1407 C5-methylase (RsmB/RsmF family)